jgi:putative membrane protein
MRHVREALSEQDRAEIERAVAEAERGTDAQVVVALAGRSGRYQRAADFFGLVVAVLALAAAWALWQRFGPNPADWTTGPAPALGLGWIVLIFVVWFIIGAAAADYWPMLARPFMTRAEQLGAVRRRGFEAFHRLSVGQTRRSSGLLIYASLFERTVWVCPDDGIAAKLGPDAWAPVSSVIAEGFRSGHPGPALANAVRTAGRVLAEHFPRTAGAPAGNELPDEVRFVADERKASGE